jgi:hypothetical protein
VPLFKAKIPQIESKSAGFYRNGTTDSSLTHWPAKHSSLFIGSPSILPYALARQAFFFFFIGPPSTITASPGLMGHCCTLQAMVCSAAPGQFAPPFAGAGLVQVRDWVSVPPPHDLVHAVLLTHGDQAPSAADRKSQSI